MENVSALFKVSINTVVSCSIFYVDFPQLVLIVVKFDVTHKHLACRLFFQMLCVHRNVATLESQKVFVVTVGQISSRKRRLTKKSVIVCCFKGSYVI